MEFRGKVWKTEGKPPWVIEVNALGVVTQGYTKKEALFMLEDAVKELILSHFGCKLQVEVVEHRKGVIGVSCSDAKLLISLSLVKQRQESGMSIRQVSSRLGSSSPNAYARYERGKVNISLEKFEELIRAVNPSLSGLMLNFER